MPDHPSRKAPMIEGMNDSSGCTCCDVSMGTYTAQIICELPFTTPRYPDGGKFVGIDRCILPAIASLWNQGIETVESCCGHGRPVGYIAVIPEHETKMEALGYVRDLKAPHVFAWPKRRFG